MMEKEKKEEKDEEFEFVRTDGWKLSMITTITPESQWGDARFVTPEGKRGGLYWESSDAEETFLKTDFERDGNVFMFSVLFPPKTEQELFHLFSSVWIPRIVAEHFSND